MATTFYSIHDVYLMHHGIKGQKWGFRRYQNTDGSLTEEGKRRYSKLEKHNINKRGAFSTRKSAVASFATRAAGIGAYVGLFSSGAFLPALGVNLGVTVASVIAAIARERKRRFATRTGLTSVNEAKKDRLISGMLGLGIVDGAVISAIISSSVPGLSQEESIKKVKEITSTRVSDIDRKRK